MSTEWSPGVSTALTVQSRGTQGSQRGGQTHKQIPCLQMKKQIRDMLQRREMSLGGARREELQLVYQQTQVSMMESTLSFHQIHPEPF